MAEYTKEQRLEIANAFSISKQFLDVGTGTRDKTDFICISLFISSRRGLISRSTCDQARNVIRERLDRSPSLYDWLVDVAGIKERDIKYEKTQKHRHAWVELGKFIKYLKETDEFTDYQVAALTQEDVDGKIMVKWKLYGEKQET